MTVDPAPELTPSTGVLLLLPYRHLEDRVLRAVAAAGHEISLAQARVFQRVSPDGSRLTDLAAAAQTSKQAAGFLVDELERSGYVVRVPDPRDGRARLIRITERGHAVIAVARVEQDRVEAEWEAHVGPRRMRELRSTLALLREITDPWQ